MRPHRYAAILAGSVALNACGDRSEPQPPPLPPSPSAHAPDDLEKGELAESQIAAMGLPIPAGLTIESITPTEIRARGQQPFDSVVDFVRDRVDAERVLRGPAKTTFDNVKVKAPRGRVPETGPDDTLRVEVATARGDTMVTCSIHRATPIPEGLTEEERWKRNGLKKNGTPADPRKFE